MQMEQREGSGDDKVETEEEAQMVADAEEAMEVAQYLALTKEKLPEPEVISVTQKILNAINKYFEGKTVGYTKDDESNETQTTLKVFDPQTNSTAIVRITSMDWL